MAFMFWITCLLPTHIYITQQSFSIFFAWKDLQSSNQAKKEKDMESRSKWSTPTCLCQRLGLDLQRNSAKSAIWSEDHSGDGSAVSFLKLSSSKSSNKDSTVRESAETANQSILGEQQTMDRN